MEGTSGIVQVLAHGQISNEMGQHCIKFCQVGSCFDYFLVL